MAKSNLLVVKTLSDSEIAINMIANELMKVGVASVHIDKVRSLYRWKGQIHDSEEYRLEALCTKDMLEVVVGLVERYHNYDLPAITWREVESTEKTYSWVTGALF